MFLHFIRCLVIITHILISVPLAVFVLFIYHHMKGQTSHLNLSSVLFWDMVGLKKGNSIMMLRHITLGFLVMLFYLKTVFLHFKTVVSSLVFFILSDFPTESFSTSRILFTLAGMMNRSLISNFTRWHSASSYSFRTSHISEPPNRYDFSSHNSMSATLNSISITSSSRQAIERECWQ